MKLRTMGALVALMIATSGCLADLLARPAPKPVSLRVEFHRNGEPATLGASTAREAVRTVMEKSKLFSSLLDKPGDDVDRLEIVLDNVGDTGEAAGKGALTGLTFGAKGSQVTDGYVFTATFRAAGKPAVTRTYRHAIHSTIGNAEGPPGLVAEESLRTAFDKVVEGLVLNLLLDLQK